MSLDSRLRAAILAIRADVAALKDRPAGGGVPTVVAAGTSYVVPANTQALWTAAIRLDDGAELAVDGALEEVF